MEGPGFIPTPIGVSIPGGDAPKTVADILTAAADLIDKPGAWSQGGCAGGTEEARPRPESPSATCWCGIGAVMAVARTRFGLAFGSGPESEACRALHDFAKALGFASFAGFNDSDERAQTEVVAALRAAAEKARTASSVGTQDRNAGRSETQNNPHPGRGEGELLPCPFCGGSDLRVGGDDKWVGACCLTCGAVGPDHYGSSNDWNRRAPTTYGKGEIENILRNRIYLQSDGDDWRVVGYEDAAEQVLQALQLGRE